MAHKKSATQKKKKQNIFDLEAQKIVGIVIIAVLAILGVSLLINTHAASPYVAVEAESGVLSGGATRTNSTLDSGGAAVVFNSGTSTTPTTPTTPVTTPTSVWQPAEDTDWQWEIGTPLVTSNTSLMGTGVTAFNGDTAPGDNPKIYDIDAIQNPASTVAALHAMGDHVICYIEVGTAGNYYSAADEGIATTYYQQLQNAGVFSSNSLSGFPEKFINYTNPAAVSIIESMIKQQCANKGFDGVETDLDETWGGEEGTPQFSPAATLTQANEEAYLTTLANFMHANNLGWISKNLDDEGSASFVSDMQPLSQGMISEECNVNASCNLLTPFLNAKKWIGNAEYTSDGTTQAKFCASDNNLNLNGVLFNVNLNTQRAPCR